MQLAFRSATIRGHAQAMHHVAGAGDTKAGVTALVAATSKEARDGHILDALTWQLQNYRSNPVVPWAHSSQDSLGRGAFEIDTGKRELAGEITWDTAHPKGAQTARQFDEGFLHAFSTGWIWGRMIPRRSLPKSDPYYKEQSESDWNQRMVGYDNELLEVSPVVVPADAGALAKRGLELPPMHSLSLEEVAEFVLELVKPELRKHDSQLDRAALVARVKADPELRRDLRALVLGLDTTPERAGAQGADWFESLR